MSKNIKYKYKYTDLSELLLKIFTFEDMLKAYKQNRNPNISWVSVIYVSDKNEYIYKITVFEEVGGASRKSL